MPNWEKLRIRISENHQKEAIIFIDFSLPSDEKRFFIVHPENGEILFSAHTAHGKGSGRGRFAEKFSDEPVLFSKYQKLYPACFDFCV